jgi:uncharacterized protein
MNSWLPVLPFDVAALIVGIALGLILGLLGGGGGLVAVPILMTFFAMSFDIASTASLVVIGVGSIVALVPHHRAKRVDWRTGILFGAVGTLGAVAAARAAFWVDDRIQQFAFAALLVIAGSIMVRGAVRAHRARSQGVDITIASQQLRPRRLIPLATGVGLTTGMFGVGGGFITVPALVAAVSMPIKRATATALVVIVINAAAALAARFSALPESSVLVPLLVGSGLGAMGGALWSRHLPSWLLSALFGALTLVIAVFTAVTA